MTIASAPLVIRAIWVPRADKGSPLLGLRRRTDHKTIGLMYLTTALTWLVVGGVMAMLLRGELARPGLQFLSPEQYDERFTIHGTIMLFFFTPIFFAFPRLNGFSYWLFVVGSFTAVATTPTGTWLSLSGSESWQLPISGGH